MQSRLDRGEHVFGDAWADRSPLELIAEAREEAADLAAWSLLALQRLGEGPGHEAAAAHLIDAINKAASAHYALETARQLAEVDHAAE